MAATKLIAMHQNKGRSVMRCLKDRTDYAMNGEKTDEGKYISSYQCNPELVDLEFAQAKKEYLHKTWRQPKGDVIAYQIRQSFKPGEITPEEANKVGYETGMRFTKGKHAFIVATHVDRAHIHNHIIFNSTNLECDRKFRDFWFSGIALQRLSDIICLEHGFSVIPKVKPSERQRRTKYPERVSMRDVIREDILKCLDQKPADFEELLKLLQAEGYEIKRGKHTAVCGKEQKRFIRFRSLGEDFTEENLKKVIAGEKELPERNEKVPERKEAKPEKRKFDLVVDIQEKMAQGKNGGYVRWAKKYNVNMCVRSSITRAEGTFVKEVVNMESMVVRGVTKDNDVARISLCHIEDTPGKAFRIFSLLAKYNINVDLIIQSIGRENTKDISFTVSEGNLKEALDLIENNKDIIGYGELSYNTEVSKVSIVGAGMVTNAGVAAKMFEALYDAHINIHMIATSEIKVSVLIDQGMENKAVKAIHDKFELA